MIDLTNIEDIAHGWAQRNEKHWSKGLPGWEFATMGFEAGAVWAGAVWAAGQREAPLPPDLMVVYPAGKVPDKATVTKKGGDKKYTLRYQIEFYDGPEGHNVITPDPRQLFIISDGVVNSILRETHVIWYTTPEELLRTINA